MDRSYREPTGKERAETERNSWFKPDLRVYTPNGKVKLTVLSDNPYSPYLGVSDGASGLDARIGDIVERVWTKAATLKVDHEIREEECRRVEAYAVRRRAQEQVRAAELQQQRGRTRDACAARSRPRWSRSLAVAQTRIGPGSLPITPRRGPFASADVDLLQTITGTAAAGLPSQRGFPYPTGGNEHRTRRRGVPCRRVVVPTATAGRGQEQKLLQ